MQNANKLRNQLSTSVNIHSTDKIRSQNAMNGLYLTYNSFVLFFLQ